MTTFRCESGVSAYTNIEYRSKLNAAPDLRIKLSGIRLNFKTIVSQTMKRFRHNINTKIKCFYDPTQNNRVF